MAKGFYEILDKIFKPYYKILFFLLLATLFGAISYYIYSNYYSNMEKKKVAVDVSNPESSSQEVLIKLFYTDWCPHCKVAMPEWSNFKDEYHNKVVGGYKILIADINCTKENDAEVAKELNANSIESYPTVKMYKGTEVIDFDAKIKYDNLEQFVYAILD